MVALTEFNENGFDPAAIKNEAMADVLTQQSFQTAQADRVKQQHIQAIMSSPDGDLRTKANAVLPFDKDLGFKLLSESRVQRKAQYDLRAGVFKTMQETVPNITTEEEYQSWRQQMGVMSQGVDGFEIDNFAESFEDFKPLKNILMGEVEGIDAMDKSIMTYEKYHSKYGASDPRTKAAASAMEREKDTFDETERKNLTSLAKEFTVESVDAYSKSNNIRDLVRATKSSDVKYKQRDVPVGEGVMQRQVSEDGGANWKNLGERFNKHKPSSSKDDKPVGASPTGGELKIVERAITDSDLKSVDEGAGAMKDYIAGEAKIRMKSQGGAYEKHVREVMEEVNRDNIGPDKDFWSPKDDKFNRGGNYQSKEEVREAFRAGKFASEEEALEAMNRFFPSN